MSEVRIPRVIANFALTWDGRISTTNRTPSDFSSAADKGRLLRIRAEGDAVLASAATVASDRMTMGLSDPDLRASRVARGQSEVPLRVVVSGSGMISERLRLFSEGEAPVVVYTTRRMPVKTRNQLRGRATVKVGEGDQVDLRRMLQSLASEFGVRSVVFEGGGTLFHAFLKEGLVSELCLTLCPRVFGGAQGISLSGMPSAWLPRSTRCQLISFEVIGGECFTRWNLDGRDFL